MVEMIDLISTFLQFATIAFCLSTGIALAFVAGAEVVVFKDDHREALLSALASSAFLTLGLWLLAG
jgi:hypothetical protein